MINWVRHQSNRSSDADCPYSSDEWEEISEEELAVSASISEWLREVTDHRTDIVERMQEKHKHLLPSCFAPSQLAGSEEVDILKVIGQTDAAGNLDGEVEIFYKNGDYFWGWYSHGVREGEGSLVENSGDHYLGKYRRGRLHGLVTETVDFSDFHNISREVFYEAISIHFYLQTFQPPTLEWSQTRILPRIQTQ